MDDTTPQELFAAETYEIFRRAHRDPALFPHEWEGLPEHYRALMTFMADHARRTGWEDTEH